MARTGAGTVLLEASRAVLSLVDHGVNRTRQAAGLGRPRLRFVLPPYLPDALTVEAASRLHDAHPAALRGVIGLDELSGMDVVHGPRPGLDR